MNCVWLLKFKDMKDFRNLLTTGVIVEFNDESYGIVCGNMILAKFNYCLIDELTDDLYIEGSSSHIVRMWDRRKGETDNDVMIGKSESLFSNFIIDDNIFWTIYDEEDDDDDTKENTSNKDLPTKKIGIYSGERYQRKHRK